MNICRSLQGDWLSGRAFHMSVLLVTVALAARCATIRQNTEAINKSSATINTNTEAVTTSTKATGTLVPALEGVERLRGPMESVANLDPTLKSVAALSDP